MDPLVTPEEIQQRLAITLDESDSQRVAILISDAQEIIDDEFAKYGRDFTAELAYPRQRRTISRVIREMVAAAVIVGPYAGARSTTSATGPQSDSVTWETVPKVSFAGVKLTDDQRRDLGLIVGNDYAPSWSFPPPARWPGRGENL